MSALKKQMEVNITDLLVVFDDILPQSKEDEAKDRYTFIGRRSNDFVIYLHVSPEDHYSSITIEVDTKRLPLIEFKFCKRITVTDTAKRSLEIIAGSEVAQNVCCTLKLTGEQRWVEVETNHVPWPPLD